MAKMDKMEKKRNSNGDIVLDTFDSYKDNSFVYGSNAKCWFKFDDGRVLFKSYNDKPRRSKEMYLDDSDDTSELMPYGEVLYSIAAKEYGVNCAKYDFATYKGEIGTISYDLVYGNNNIAIDGLTLFARYNPDHLPDIMRKNTNNLDVIMMFNKKYNNYKELSKVFEARYPEDVERLQNELVNIFVLDVLFDHVDKNLWNIMVVTDEYGNDPHVVSIDSSHIACLYRGQRYIEEAVNSLLTSDGTITIEDYLRGGVYGYDVNVKEENYNPSKDLIDFYYSLDQNKRDELFKFVKDFDIKKILNEVSKIKNVDPIVKTWISAVVNSRKSFLLKKFYHINDNYKDDHTSKNFHLKKRNTKMI